MSLYFLCCSVNVSVCLICCVLDSVCELFDECLLNVMDVLVWVEVLCWIDRVWSST